jgi:predicted nucleotidyltransferase
MTTLSSNKEGTPMFAIKTSKQQKAFLYAIEQIRNSGIFPLVNQIILYGSCARSEEKWNSDVDIMLELSNMDSVNTRDICQLKSNVMTDNLMDAEVDLKITTAGWESRENSFFKNVKKEGIVVWSR